MSLRRRGFLVGVLLAAAATGAAEGPPPEPPLMPPAGAKADSHPQADQLIVTTPEKLLEMLADMARKANAKTPPSACRLLGGEVKDSSVQFKAEFDFHAERADQVFALACGQAKARSATQQDGRTPILSSDADGYRVLVEKPGDYTVTLDLSLPLAQRPGGRGFELDLPRAVVTLIEMTLPQGARGPRINGKDLSEWPVAFDNGQLRGPIGPVDKLDVAWQGAGPAGVPPLQTVRGRVMVRVEEEWMRTDAELVLHPQGGPVKTWVVIVPPGFDLKTSAADPQRVQIERQEEPGDVRYTVRLKGPGDDDLTVTATARASLADGKRKPVGPFLVPAAGRHSGEVLVSVAGPDVRPVLHPHPDLTQRDLTDDEKRADPGMTVYEYGTAPVGAPWLEVEPVSAHESIKTQDGYVLSLVRTGPGAALEWQVLTTITVSSRGGVDHLDVRLGPDSEYLAAPAADGGNPAVNRIEPDAGDPHLLHIFLNGAQTGQFSVAFRARYTSASPVAVPSLKPTTFTLPRPANSMSDSRTQIAAAVPDDLELLPPADAEVTDAHRIVWRNQPPEQPALSWQTYHPEVHVSSVIDLTLRGRQAEVKHEMHFHFPHAAPKQLTLKTPAAIGASLQVQGAVLADEAAQAPETRTLKLQGAAQDQTATLMYSFSLDSGPIAPWLAGDSRSESPTIPVPLVSVDQAKGGDARVRVWCDPGRLPAAPGGEWMERDIEEVKGVNRLPILVLESARPGASLTLAFPGGLSLNPAAAVLVDRCLCRASLEGETWDIRVTYLIRQPAGAYLDVELPDAPAALRLHVKLDDREVDPETVERGDNHIARLRVGGDLVPRLQRGNEAAVLELTYKLPARGTLANALAPPVLAGDSRQAPTRWQVTLPADYIALAPEAGAAARWTVGLRRGWLPAPQPAVTDEDLEEWFAGAEVPGWPKGARVAPSLVVWHDEGQPLVVAYIPEWRWLALCSVPLVLLGLLLFALARRSWGGSRWAAILFWLVAVALTFAAGVGWALFPTALYAVVFGCEPGAVVLLLFLGMQVLMLERYRRRIVFLPNFRRARTGSSLVRANGSQRPAGEPSTVDHPHTAGSSQQPV